MNTRLCRNVVAAAAVAIMAGVAIDAQDKKMDTMPMKAKEMTYTGCVDRSASGQFSLTHATAGDAMKMSKDKMAHDMDKNPMAKEAKDPMAKESMAKESMASDMLSLSSPSIDLSKHVGHKVSVKGVGGDAMGGTPTFTVKTVKMLADSCM
jgi:hypothetical protein